MLDLLRYANYAKVAEDLGVTRQTVARWAKGESVPIWATRQVERLIVGDRKEAPLAEQLEGLEQRLTAAIEANRELLRQALADAIVTALPPELFRPPDAGAPDGNGNPTDKPGGQVRERR